MRQMRAITMLFGRHDHVRSQSANSELVGQPQSGILGYVFIGVWVVFSGIVLGSKLGVLSVQLRDYAELLIVLFLLILVALTAYMCRDVLKDTQMRVVVWGCVAVAILSRLIDMKFVRQWILDKDPVLHQIYSASERSLDIAIIGLLVFGFCKVILTLRQTIATLEMEQRNLLAEQSERQAAAVALSASDAKFRSMAESTAAAIYIIQEDKCVYANPAACKMSGYTTDELLSLTFDEFFMLERHGKCRNLALEWQEGLEIPISFEGKFRTKTAAVRWGATTVAPTDYDGRRALIGTTFDITDRKEAEQALEQREEWFRRLVQDSADITCVVGPEGTLDYVTPSEPIVPGYDIIDGLVGENLFDYIHPDDLNDCLDAFQRIMATPGNVERQVFRFRTPEDQWAHLEAHGRNLIHDPVIGGIVVNARNVTERMEMQEKLRQSQKMEILGQLAGGVAHDFNNLLMTILIRSELLEMDESIGECALEEIAEIRKAGERAARLTGQLLTFGRREKNNVEQIDLAHAIHEMEKMLHRVLGEDIRLVTDAESDQCTFMANPSHVEQVLLNLAVNARDAMPLGGTLFISARRVNSAHRGQNVEHTASGDFVSLCIRDTGCGMDKETQAQVFEPFFTTKAPGQGTGLGLSTVFDIVKRYDGNIGLESKPGEGTSFSISFPYSSELDVGEKTQIEAKFDDINAEKRTVLIIEDDAEVRALTGRILSDAGFMTILAADTDDAIRMCADPSTQIDLAISDVVMPNMGGPELVKELKAQRPDLKILFMSGYTSDRLERYGLDSYDANYLNKPFSPKALLKTVQDSFTD